MLWKFLTDFVHSGPAVSLRHSFLHWHVFLLNPLDGLWQVRFLFLLLLFFLLFLRLFTTSWRLFLRLLLFLAFFGLWLRHRITEFLDADYRGCCLVEEWAVNRFSELECWLEILGWSIQLQFRVILRDASDDSRRLGCSSWLVLESRVKRACKWSMHLDEGLSCRSLSIWKHLYRRLYTFKSNLLISRLGAGLCLLSRGLVIVVG